MLVTGIDIGPITTESLLFERDSGVLEHAILQTGTDSKRSAETALEAVFAGLAITVSDAP
jgi:hypothetical protein